MKSINTYILIALASCFSFAFQSPENNGLQARYGLLNSEPTKIELSLNKDFSFTYQDYSIPNKSIEVSGIYHVKGNRIFLQSKQQDIAFRDKWRIKHEGKSIVSREGMCFYILRKKTN